MKKLILLFPIVCHPVMNKEADTIKKGMENIGIASTTIALASFDKFGSNAFATGSTLAISIKEGGSEIKNGLNSIGQGILFAVGITTTYLAFKSIQPYIWPTTTQKNEQLRIKNEYESRLSQTMFVDCIHKNRTCPDNEMGFPASCTSNAREFITKAGEAHFKSVLQDHYKKI